jgi:hypothetical protein
MLRNILRWCRITKAGSDTGQFPVQQMEYLGKVGDGAMLFPYGVHGNVPADTLTLMGAVQGNPDNRVAIGVLPKNRPALKDGEVAFYHPPTGSFIKWDSSGNLLISNGTATWAMVGNTVTLTGNLVVTGTITNDGSDVGKTHGHAQGADSNGDSQAAISGVT